MAEDTTNYRNKVKSALSDIRFPATKEQILQSKGAARVDVAMGKSVTVREALDPIRKERFDTPDALLNEINSAHHLNWPEM